MIREQSTFSIDRSKSITSCAGCSNAPQARASMVGIVEIYMLYHLACQKS